MSDKLVNEMLINLTNIIGDLQDIILKQDEAIKALRSDLNDHIKYNHNLTDKDGKNDEA